MSQVDDATGLGRLEPKSLVQLAADAVRKKILAGDLEPGERLIEERLTKELGISRPPLREALRLLQQEGLVVNQPRRGSTVVELTSEDVYEILTLRSGLERMAVELGVPVQDPARLEVCRQALARMRACAQAEDRGGLVEAGYAFHASIVALAGHGRLSAMYNSLYQQLLLCMARNLYVRERFYEDLETHVDRHQELLDVVERGDPKAVLEALAAHGERSFSSM
ncbi:GntR family transcriptional regulator [Phytoactinopolyspora halotolerans]|uniref:GntR family transcriptional regulator n=1 Tax=Phytoactinopolyspora halotolerans TaxID=1981512 RepID=A0A6L9RZJ8_9ACTN|nr:GntR family transcriptional regulator [Phytoactinopolyspora halotolerans]NED98564.1 GntR family transcriptional regulator [Phytoactinopolyspora halotolerans]